MNTPWNKYVAFKKNNIHAVPIFYVKKFENEFKELPEMVGSSDKYYFYKEE